MGLLFLAIGLLPGFLWLWYICRQDKFDREPLKLLLWAFILGMMCVVPAAVLETVGENYLASEIAKPSMTFQFLFFFLIVGPIEELLKYAVVKKYLYPKVEFDEPMDGIVYGSAAALGFASLENIFYMMHFGTSIILLRAVTSTLAHILFSGAWGAPLGLLKFHPEQRSLLFRGLLLAMFLHGLFDFLLVTGEWWGILAVLALMVGMWKRLHVRITQALAESPHVH